MSKTFCLVLEKGIEPIYETKLETAAKQLGWTILEVQGIPFANYFNNKKDFPCTSDDLYLLNSWFHGSIQSSKIAVQSSSWNVHTPWEALECCNYYKVFEGYLFQENIVFTSLEKLLTDPLKYFKEIGIDNTLFIRPNGCDKAFNAGLVYQEDFAKSWEIINFYNPPLDTSIVLASPKKILAEARFLVVDNIVVTGSYYRIGTQKIELEALPEMIEAAQKIINACNPNIAPSWTLDLALDTDNVWKVLEIGATSCSGLYACNMEKFLKALENTL